MGGSASARFLGYFKAWGAAVSLRAPRLDLFLSSPRKPRNGGKTKGKKWRWLHPLWGMRMVGPDDEKEPCSFGGIAPWRFALPPQAMRPKPASGGSLF